MNRTAHPALAALLTLLPACSAAHAGSADIPGMLEQVSQKARQAAQERFSLDSMVQNYLTAFRRVAGRNQ